MFLLSCKNDYSKNVIYDLKLYSTADDFYSQLDKLVEEKKTFKIKSEKSKGIYYSTYADTVRPTILERDKYADKNYSYYGIITPVMIGNYVQKVRIYFFPEINETFSEFYDRFYINKNAYFWAKWELGKTPNIRIIENLNSKFSKWTIQYSNCDKDMVDPRLPFTPQCAIYNWFNNGVQIKFIHSCEVKNFTESLHLEYALDSATESHNQTQINRLVDINEEEKF